MNMKPTKFGVGQSVKRVEDIRFVSGRGNYASDAVDKAELKAVFLRSPYGHAKFRVDDVRSGARGARAFELSMSPAISPPLATCLASLHSPTPTGRRLRSSLIR